MYFYYWTMTSPWWKWFQNRNYCFPAARRRITLPTEVKNSPPLSLCECRICRTYACSVYNIPIPKLITVPPRQNTRNANFSCLLCVCVTLPVTLMLIVVVIVALRKILYLKGRNMQGTGKNCLARSKMIYSTRHILSG